MTPPQQMGSRVTTRTIGKRRTWQIRSCHRCPFPRAALQCRNIRWRGRPPSARASANTCTRPRHEIRPQSRHRRHRGSYLPHISDTAAEFDRRAASPTTIAPVAATAAATAANPSPWLTHHNCQLRLPDHSPPARSQNHRRIEPPPPPPPLLFRPSFDCHSPPPRRPVTVAAQDSWIGHSEPSPTAPTPRAVAAVRTSREPLSHPVDQAPQTEILDGQADTLTS